MIAFALYLVCSYFLLPLYRQRQRYAQYLPVALTASDQPGIISRTRLRVQEDWQTLPGRGYGGGGPAMRIQTCTLAMRNWRRRYTQSTCRGTRRIGGRSGG